MKTTLLTLAVTVLASAGASCSRPETDVTTVKSSQPQIGEGSLIMDFGSSTMAPGGYGILLPGNRRFCYKDSIQADVSGGKLHIATEPDATKAETFGWATAVWFSDSCWMGDAISLPAGVYELEFSGVVSFLDLKMLIADQKINVEPYDNYASKEQAINHLNFAFLTNATRTKTSLFFNLAQASQMNGFGFESWGWAYEPTPGVPSLDIRLGKLKFHGPRQ